VTRSVIGNAGSQLFAASSATPITRVVLTTPAGANGFALAQFRYALEPPAPGIPVPGTLILSGVGILLLAGQRLLAGKRLLARRRTTGA
jgi:hypothetical protein